MVPPTLALLVTWRKPAQVWYRSLVTTPIPRVFFYISTSVLASVREQLIIVFDTLNILQCLTYFVVCKSLLYDVKAEINPHIQRYTPITCYTTAPRYNIIIMFDTVVRQKRNFKHERKRFHQCRLIVTLACVTEAWPLTSQRVRHTSTVGNVTISIDEWPYYCCIHMPTFRIVWLLRSLNLGSKLCLRDDKNAAFVAQYWFV